MRIEWISYSFVPHFGDDAHMFLWCFQWIDWNLTSEEHVTTQCLPYDLAKSHIYRHCATPAKTSAKYVYGTNNILYEIIVLIQKEMRLTSEHL